MAKEIVIQQLLVVDISLHKDDQRNRIHVKQAPSDWVEVEPENVPRLISALCELSGVSGVPTRDEFVKSLEPVLLAYHDSGEASVNQEARIIYQHVAPLIARLQAEKQSLSESNDNLNEANKQLSMDVHVLQAENEEIRASQGAFAEWAAKNDWEYIPVRNVWEHAINPDMQHKTTAQLLAEFRKETGK